MQISLCPSPELYHLYQQEGATVIVTDVFRATTTMTTAFDNGTVGILPVSSVEDAERIGTERGYLMAAERHVVKCAFAQLGNDPLEYVLSLVQGREIVMTTTNGTRAIHVALEAGATEVLVGSFRNLPATLAYLQSKAVEQVVVIAAGWQGQASAEDCLYAAGLIHLAVEAQVGQASGDMARMIYDLYRHHASTPASCLQYLKSSEHYARLERTGYAHTAGYCLEIGVSEAVLGIVSEAGEHWVRRLA